MLLYNNLLYYHENRIYFIHEITIQKYNFRIWWLNKEYSFESSFHWLWGSWCEKVLKEIITGSLYQAIYAINICTFCFASFYSDTPLLHYGWIWYIHPYSPGLVNWRWCNRLITMIVPVQVKYSWRKWTNPSATTVSIIHERHDFLNHRQLDWLFNKFVQTKREIHL